MQKPDITAADGTATATPGFQPFYGTSSAAPHAAAIAALLKSAAPALTPAQIRTALINSAIDIEEPGADRDAGAGIIMAYEALVAAGVTSPYATLGLGAVTTAEGNFSNSNGILEPGELANLTIELKDLSPNINATNVSAVLSSATAGVTIVQNIYDYGDIPALGAVNTATPFIIGIGSSVPCGSVINFTLTVTFGGGETAQQIVTLNPIKLGVKIPINATLGSAPPTGSGYVSSSGSQTDRFNRNGAVPSCGVAKATPAIQNAGGTRAYHAYTFTNTSGSSQCVTISISSGTPAGIYEVVYGNGGFNPASITSNYLADQGTTTNVSPFSFTAPAGQQYTVVVHEVNQGAGTGINYSLMVDQYNICEATPACTPVVLSPASIPDAVYGSAYTQTFSASGGSGSYLFSMTGTLPAGLSFSGNTLSGTPTETGSFPLTVTATDATGCPAGTLNYTLESISSITTTFTTLTSDPNPTCLGTETTYTATVVSNGNPVTDGTVTFTEGATELAGNVILDANGEASFNTSSLTEGSHTIVATYNGTSVFLTSNGSSSHLVNPTPNVVATPSAQTICSGENITPILNSGNVAGTIYNWTRDNTVDVTGIASPGTSDISGSLTNTTNAPVTVTFTITPSYTNAGVTCTGAAKTATVVVNPAKGVDQPDNQVVCNNGATLPVNFTGSAAGFDWSNNTTSIGLASGGTGNIPSFVTTNATNAPVTATVTVTPSASGFAYIPNFSSNNVSVINTATNSVVGSPIAVGSFPLGISVSPDGTRAYVSNVGSNDVSVINTATNTVVGSPIAVGAWPGGISVSPDGTRVFVANNDNQNVSVINTVTNMVVGSPIAVGIKPAGISVSPDGTRVYVANNGSNSVSVINASTNTVVGSPISVGTGPIGISVSPDGTRVYVSNLGSNNVSVINTATNSVVGSPIVVGVFPSGISISPDGTKVYVANRNDNSVSVINTATNTVIGSLIGVGIAPYAFGNFIIGGGAVCTGAAKTFTITVNPTPNVVATPSSQTICSGENITTIVNSGDVAGTVYNWTRDNTVDVTGIVSPGSGDISGALTNTTNAPVTVTFTITPSYTNAGATCAGTPITATVIVNPKPNVSFSGLSASYCLDAGSVTLTGSPAGGIFSGPGINGDSFDPALAGIGGPYTIAYSFTDGNGCSNSISQTVSVTETLTWYLDADGDGYYATTQQSCISPGATWSLTTLGADCNDNEYNPTNSYAITVVQTAGGVISPGTTSVSCNGDATFTITPDAGFTLQNIIKDGIPQAASASITFTNVTTGHTLSATFISNATCSATGNITYQIWNNIGSSKLVSSLTGNIDYPNNPTTSTLITSMEGISNQADNYGSRIVGYICAPATGSYTFWIASDDYAELWLSTDDQQANKQNIAFHNGATLSRQWNKYVTQKSVPINLVQGQRYFIEALMKEGTGTDNLAVGWLKPGQTGTSPSEVIPGSVLSPIGPVQPVLVSSVTLPPSSSVNVGSTVLIPATVLPVNASNQVLVWTTSDPTIAQVNSSGQVTGIVAGPVTITATSTDGSNKSGSCLVTVTTVPTVCSATGTITYQVWNNIGSSKFVSSLTGNINYPNNPTTSTLITSMEGISNQADNYGSRIVGYICAPATGSYTFWIASDDYAELWLSTDDQQANKQNIAFHNGATLSRQWNKYVTQKSVPINLVQGQRYFIEALMKEGTGTDNLAVGWLKPGQNGTSPSEVIPGSVLSPLGPVQPVLVSSVTLPPSSSVNVGSTVLIPATVLPVNASNQVLTWTTSDPTIAQVNSNGQVTGIVAGPVTITATSTDGSNKSGSCLVTVTAVSTVCSATGNITYQVWNNIGSSKFVSSLTGNINYPNNPTSSTLITSMEGISNQADNYGSRIAGYICAPATGSYTFWIASDDYAELWLSTDDQQANKQNIAFHNGATLSRQWNKYVTQKSVPINLVQGQRYFIEALMKEGTGTDNLAVGWLKPGQNGTSPSEVIPGSVLSPLVVPAKARESFVENPVDLEKDVTLKVYPNPLMSDELNIRLENLTSVATLKIYTMSGVECYERLVESSDIIRVDRSVFKSGIYIIKVQNESFTKTAKLVVN